MERRRYLVSSQGGHCVAFTKLDKPEEEMVRWRNMEEEVPTHVLSAE